MNPDLPIVEIQQLVKGYQKGRRHVEVVRSADLVVRAGEFVALMGPSGSGKSTLLNLLGGLSHADRGTVRVHGVDLGPMTEAQRTRWRAAHVGYVFQRYHLIGSLTAAQNVELPLLLRPMGGAERLARVRNALDLVGMLPRAEHLPSELSGGQEQRTAIARALVADPPLLLCDEPTGNLDAAAGQEVLELLKAVNTSHGTTIIMVTHSLHAASFARRVLTMDDGVVREAGPVAQASAGVG